jgi:DNA-directed RNA polymerase specialized sigma24 family protein
MENHGERIIKYTESVLRFCLSRVGNRQGAEDLAAEIILYALDGLEKYEIKSLDAWVMARRAQPMRALFPVEKQ